MELLRGKSEQTQDACHHPKEVSFKSGPLERDELAGRREGQKGKEKKEAGPHPPGL